jgi:hypothetical protein
LHRMQDNFISLELLEALLLVDKLVKTFSKSFFNRQHRQEATSELSASGKEFN